MTLQGLVRTSMKDISSPAAAADRHERASICSQRKQYQSPEIMILLSFVPHRSSTFVTICTLAKRSPNMSAFTFTNKHRASMLSVLKNIKTVATGLSPEETLDRDEWNRRASDGYDCWTPIGRGRGVTDTIIFFGDHPGCVCIAYVQSKMASDDCLSSQMAPRAESADKDAPISCKAHPYR